MLFSGLKGFFSALPTPPTPPTLGLSPSGSVSEELVVGDEELAEVL
jgi:hypothetical protein